MFGKVEEPRQDRQMDFSVCFRRPIQMLSRPGLSSLAVSHLFAVLAARARRGVVRLGRVAHHLLRAGRRCVFVPGNKVKVATCRWRMVTCDEVHDWNLLCFALSWGKLGFR